MSNISVIVENIKKQVDSAEGIFSSRIKSVQRRASSTTINVSELNTALEIVADAKKASDELYASYEAAIMTLDMECRPFIEQISASEMHEIISLMRYINEGSSSICGNFTGSFNGQSIGDLVGMQYCASLQAKTIEKFWSNKYSLMPEAIELEKERKRIAKEKEEERKAKEEEALRIKKEEEEKAAEEAKRNAKEASEKLAKKRTAIQNELNALYNALDDEVKDIKRKVDDAEREVKELTKRKAELGFFKFKEKSAIDNRIDELNCTIEVSNNYIDNINEKYDDKTDSLEILLSFLNAKVGDVVSLGIVPYSPDVIMDWYVIGVSANKVDIIAKESIYMLSYHEAKKWVSSDFINDYLYDEKNYLVKVDGQFARLPSSAEATSLKTKMPAKATFYLRSHIINEEKEQGRRCYYTNLQVSNAIKDAEERAGYYWVESGEARNGWASHVTLDYERWIIGKIGSGATFGIRPVVTIDLLKI